jgi:hypothetical protein
MKRLLMASILVIVLVFSGTIMAQDKPTSIGIGAHIGWPTLIGPSIKVWLTPQFGIQGMGSFFSAGDASLTMLGGRGLFKLSQADTKISPYLGAGAGVWIAKEDNAYVCDGFWDCRYEDQSESVATFEFLLGFQHRYSTNFYGDYELGYYIINFDEVDVDISGMSFMLAFHYFF